MQVELNAIGKRTGSSVGPGKCLSILSLSAGMQPCTNGIGSDTFGGGWLLDANSIKAGQ